MEFRSKSVTENYRERVERLGLFDCLYELKRKKKKDNKGRVIDFYSLGLLALLFFFENMLVRNKNTGVKELSAYYIDINKGEIDLTHNEFENIARIVIETFRPSGGKGVSIEFYNWETRKNERIKYSYLKASKSDLKSNTQYYTLDEHGLELIFATKEYYGEFQLSIKQLLLRKQLEKGEFAGALRQIDEMRIDVESLSERIIKVKHEIQRNILSEKIYDRYKQLIEDISQRLVRENDEFDELINFVIETRDAVSYEKRDEKDLKAYNYMIKIQNELSNVHRYHRELLRKSIELKTSTLEAAQESLYYMGVESFNIKNEITARLFSSPLPLESSRHLIEPFLYLEHKKAWSPLSIFSPQRLINKEREKKASAFLESKTQAEEEKENRLLQECFSEITKIVIDMLSNCGETKLSEIIDYIKSKNYDDKLSEVYFYHFFIILHQNSPIELKKKTRDTSGTLKMSLNLFEKEYSRIEVFELHNVIYVNERFYIKDMVIKGDVK